MESLLRLAELWEGSTSSGADPRKIVRIVMTKAM
jgi:hypothetical protein